MAMAPLDIVTAHPYGAVLLLLLGIHTAHRLFYLLRNIRLARSTGLPYLIYPIAMNTPLLVVALSQPCAQALITRLPQVVQDYLFLTTYNTHWRVGGRMVQRLGSVFLVASPRGLTAFVADAEAVREIMMNRERFPKPVGLYRRISIYGPNLIASEGAQWVHHKKFTTSPFGERNNKLTWLVALQQTQEMMESWATDSSAHEFTPDVQDDLFRLALHGFSEAGFGIPMSFRQENMEGADSASHGFHKALSLICSNLMKHALVMWFLPPLLRPKKHQEAHITFSSYVASMVAKADRGGNTLLDLLVAAEGLSEEEVMGNLFVFIVAGHETTAGTMHYALILLALHPEVQSWVRENVDEVLGGLGSDVEAWKYEEVFPKLGRVLCVMLEILRLYPQTPFIPKATATGTTLTIDGTIYPLPPMHINICATSVQLSQRYYGSNAADFDPSRWDASNASSFLAKNKGMQGLQAPGLESPAVHRPERGSYVAFSDGPRACLGRKFGQVVFVAVIATVLREFEVDFVVRESETRKMAEERVRGALKRSFATVTLGVSEEVRLVLRRRT